MSVVTSIIQHKGCLIKQCGHLSQSEQGMSNKNGVVTLVSVNRGCLIKNIKKCGHLNYSEQGMFNKTMWSPQSV